MQAVGCGGETQSLLNADQPDLLSSLRILDIDWLWHRYLQECCGDPAGLLERCASGELELDVLVVEGAVSTGSQAGLVDRSLERPLGEWIERLAAVAGYAVAVGTCASFGGVLASGRNPSGVTGLQFDGARPGGLLGAAYRSQHGLPVINVPGCPAHPDWMVGTLFALISDGLALRDLDRYHRPRVFYSKLAHHGCPRNEYYEFGSSAEEFSQQGCLFENLGCKGTQCESDCNERLWMGRTGSCPRGGFPCLSCTSPHFPDGFAPFFETQKIGDIPTSLPLDVPKAWYVGINGLSKLACPERLRRNAVSFKRVGPGAGGQSSEEGDERAPDDLL
ncbi:MAG: HupU protein [Deltaproteobacteria bacterium]|nr:HupU protein [Deltaproteobacteria bacterium]